MSVPTITLRWADGYCRSMYIASVDGVKDDDISSSVQDGDYVRRSDYDAMEQERDTLKVKLASAEYAIRYAKFAIETTNTMNGFTQSNALELINEVLAGRVLEQIGTGGEG